MSGLHPMNWRLEAKTEFSWKENSASRQHQICLSFQPYRLIYKYQTCIFICICICIYTYGIPWWLRWQRVCLQYERPELDPWVRKTAWRRKWQPTPVFLPGKPHGRRSLAGYSSQGCKESDTIYRLHFHFHVHIYMYVCMYTHMYLCLCMHMCRYLCIHTYIYLSIYLYIWPKTYNGLTGLTYNFSTSPMMQKWNTFSRNYTLNFGLFPGWQ